MVLFNWSSKPKGHVNIQETKSLSNPKTEEREILAIADLSLCELNIRCIMLVTLSLTCVQLYATSWAVAHQAPLSMGSSRQEYQSGLPFPPPWDLPNPGIQLANPRLLWLLHWQADSSPLSHLGSPNIWYNSEISCTFSFSTFPQRNRNEAFKE